MNHTRLRFVSGHHFDTTTDLGEVLTLLHLAAGNNSFAEFEHVSGRKQHINPSTVEAAEAVLARRHAPAPVL